MSTETIERGIVEARPGPPPPPSPPFRRGVDRGRYRSGSGICGSRVCMCTHGHARARASARFPVRHCRDIRNEPPRKRTRRKSRAYECCMAFAVCKYVTLSLLLAFAILNYAFSVLAIRA